MTTKTALSMSDKDMSKEAACYLKAKADKAEAVRRLAVSERLLRKGLKERKSRILQFGDNVVGMTATGNRLFVTPVDEMNHKPLRRDGVPF